MMWELEFRRVADGEWTLFTRGTLEECLADALRLKAGDHSWRQFYNGARLVMEVTP